MAIRFMISRAYIFESLVTAQVFSNRGEVLSWHAH